MCQGKQTQGIQIPRERNPRLQRLPSEQLHSTEHAHHCQESLLQVNAMNMVERLRTPRDWGYRPLPDPYTKCVSPVASWWYYLQSYSHATLDIKRSTASHASSNLTSQSMLIIVNRIKRGGRAVDGRHRDSHLLDPVQPPLVTIWRRSPQNYPHKPS